MPKLVSLSDETVAAVNSAMAYDPEWGDEWPDLALEALDAVQRDIEAAERDNPTDDRLHFCHVPGCHFAHPAGPTPNTLILNDATFPINDGIVQ